MGNNFSNDTSAPLLAPHWTRAGYSGRLKDKVIEACYNKYNQQQNEEPTESQHVNPNHETSSIVKQGLGDLDSNDTSLDKPCDHNDGNDGNDADGSEEEVEEVVLLSSNDNQNTDDVDQNTDDDRLEMDD